MTAMRKHTILYTTPYGNMFGGGQWSLYHFIKRLDKNIYHPILLCPEEGELAKLMAGAGADIVFLKIGRMRHLNLLTIWKLISIIKERKICLVHTDSLAETLYAGIAARVAGIPLVWHIRVSDREWLLDRILSLLPKKMILVANALKTRFEWLEGTHKMVTIYNGIDIKEFDSFPSSCIRQEFGINESTVLLACIGRIEERKGQEYLIAAVRYIDNAKLLLVGTGEDAYLKHIKTLCDEYKISDRVIFTGYRNDIPSVLREVDIFVFPVISGEGFSRAILEAMVAAKPVIASDDAGNPEAVTDGITGYIVPRRNSMLLAERIKELVNSKERRNQMGLAGRGKVEERFRIEKDVACTEALYRTLITGEQI